MLRAKGRRKEDDDEKAGWAGCAVTVECDSLGTQSSRTRTCPVRWVPCAR